MKAKIAALGLLLLPCGSFAGSIESIIPEVQQCAALASVIAAVQAQNATHLTPDQIKALDKSWTDASGKIPEATALTENDAAKALASCEAAKPYFKESILTDNQGANVAITELTSDYWQGDEPKFAEAYANGIGKTYIARPKQDSSAGETLAQVSVPVMHEGKAIGTLTMGVRVSLIP